MRYGDLITIPENSGLFASIPHLMSHGIGSPTCKADHTREKKGS